jgi:hypothetical protein
VARAQTAWRCSQCGTVNEAGTRSCSNCGKWPSLFDLQDSVGELPDEAEAQATFEPELFEPETFEPETYEPRPYETDLPEQDTFEPEPEDGDETERRSRFPRWAITAIWVVGLIIWFLANALGDRS